MTNDLRLAVRLIRGGGAGGYVRLALMAIGYGLGAVVVLLLAALPAVLRERGDITAARQPISAEDSVSFRSNFNFGSWRGVRFTRVLIADAAPNAPLPAGVAALPEPGETVLSPAAARLARHDANFGALLPGRQVGRIDESGLLGPDELYAYVGVTIDEMPSGSPSRGWGGFATDEEMRDQFSTVPLQLLLIVSAPAVLYFAVCSRLSAASRRRRYAALRLVGMNRRRVLRLAAIEAAAAGLAGGLLGLAAYAALNRVIGPSGILGFTWYPEASAFSLVGGVAMVLVLGLLAGAVGGASSARALFRPVEARFDAADRPPRWWQVAPLVFGLGLIVYPLLLDNRPPGQAMDQTSGILLLLGVVLSALGLLISLRTVLVAIARTVANNRAPLVLRLAARRVEYESVGTARHLAGLCSLVLVATVGAGVLRQTELSATPVAERLIVKVNGQDVPVAARERMAELPAQGHWVQQRSVTSPPPLGAMPSTPEDFIRFQGVELVVATCQSLRRNTRQPLEGCRDGAAYRIQQGGPSALSLSPGLDVTFQNAQKQPVTIKTPEQTIDLGAGEGLPRGMAILVTGDSSPLGLTEESFLFYQLSAEVAEVDRFVTGIGTAAPAATLTVFGLDLPALETYRVHRGVVGVGLLLAFLGSTAVLVGRVHDRPGSGGQRPPRRRLAMVIN
ncbi:FtsX-like permease family protein, partial [Micromonospora olivasterospora]